MRFSRSASVALLSFSLGVAAGACTPLKSHQGYIIDADLVNSVQPGVDTRQSVLATLGQPSFASQFNQGDWYYIARDSKNYAFNSPRVDKQVTLQISFDPAGNVAAVRRSGAEQVVSIDPSNRATPTLGRKRSFFDDLFGNIGAVGAAGGPGSGGGGGAGRTQP